MNNKDLANTIVTDINNLLKELRLESSQQFQVLKSQITELQLQVKSMEKNFQNKVIHDEKRYGHIQYKLFETKPN